MNKIIITGAGLFLALTLAFLLVWPKYQNLQTLKAGIKEKELTLKSQQNYYAKIKEINLQLQEYLEPMAKISSALPKEPAPASLASFLQDNAAQAGLIFKKITLGGTVAPEAAGNSLQETRAIIQVTGSYKSFKDFLSAVESSARLIEVQNISIEIPSKESKEQPVFTLNIKTYSY